MQEVLRRIVSMRKRALLLLVWGLAGCGERKPRTRKGKMPFWRNLFSEAFHG